MQWLLKKIKDESAGAMIENVIVLPLVFIIIFFLLLSSFMMHDRATIEAAAKRGAVYAASCISNPNYATIVGQTGELDLPYTAENNFNFKSVGGNVNAYRAFTGGNNMSSAVTTQVEKIIAKTRIPWLPQESVDVEYQQKNMFIYQDVTVTVRATYHLPEFFSLIGLETKYTYEATAKTRTTDPDEFIRNADLIVDLITMVDDKLLDNRLQKVTNKISDLATKVLDWLGDKSKK